MRQSPLSIAQGRWIQAQLKRHGIDAEIFPLVTTGDRILNEPLTELGGKGLFTKEIEEALLTHQIDVAVHSFKDLPTDLPPGLMVAAVPMREDVRDVWVSNNPTWTSMEAIPQGTKIGTASLRRKVQLQHANPWLEVKTIRGNIGTRIQKMQEGVVDALVLSLIGFERMAWMHHVTHIFSIQEMLPAVAQGALALECCTTRTDVVEKLKCLHHPPSAICIEMERAFLKAMEGSCRTPIGGYARFQENKIVFQGFIATLDALIISRIEDIFTPGQGLSHLEFGRQQGLKLLERHQQQVRLTPFP